MLVLSCVFGSSSNMLQQKTPTVQLLIYARGTSKIPGSKTSVQGFLVLYHEEAKITSSPSTTIGLMDLQSDQ